MRNQIERTENQRSLLLGRWVDGEKQRIFKFLLKLSSEVNTDTSLQFHTAIAGNSHMSLDNVGWSPTSDHRENVLNYFFTEVLSKSDFLDRDDDIEYNTWKKFIDSEARCYETGLLLEHLQSTSFTSSILDEAAYYIKKMLRDLPESKAFMKWGPGVTKTIKGKYVASDKIKEIPFRVPRSAFHYHSNFISEYMQRYDSTAGGAYCPLESWYEFDEVSLLCRVPKSSKTDRTISIEPTGLVTLTLHYGDILRRRLRKAWDVRLDDQSINQWLAKNAIDLNLATVDLSSASDSITPALIARLFPPEWADMILCLRTSGYVLSRDSGSRIYPTYKCAGMGNGITFPLQTIIYHSIVMALTIRAGHNINHCHTYGDDIIIHNTLVMDLKRVLRDVGFIFNDKKSHYLNDDLFRESCGEHFYDSKCITPAYIKNVGKDLETCVRNHNRIFRWLVKHRLFDFIPLMNILRKDCPEVVYDPIDYARDHEGNLLVSECDKGFFVVKDDGHKNTTKLHTRKGYMQISTHDALLLKLFDLETRGKPPVVNISNGRQKRQFYRDVIERIVLPELRSYSLDRSGREDVVWVETHVTQ